MNPRCRPITPLGWILGVVFLPCGMFLALATARAMSWIKAIAWFLLYLGMTLCFARGMAHLESIQASDTVLLLFLNFGITILLSELCLIYHYGQKAGFWTARAQREWRMLALLFFSAYILQSILILMRMVIIPLWIR